MLQNIRKLSSSFVFGLSPGYIVEQAWVGSSEATGRLLKVETLLFLLAYNLALQLISWTCFLVGELEVTPLVHFLHNHSELRSIFTGHWKNKLQNNLPGLVPVVFWGQELLCMTVSPTLDWHFIRQGHGAHRDIALCSACVRKIKVRANTNLAQGWGLAQCRGSGITSHEVGERLEPGDPENQVPWQGGGELA